MSQSPPTATSPGEIDGYLENWNALAGLVAHGASFSGRERNCCFLNTAGARFADVSAAAGLDLIDDGRGLATVDWDHDGDLDLWLTNRTGPRIRMMRNDMNAGNRFVVLRLEGTTCNRDAIGARVELYLKSWDRQSPPRATGEIPDKARKLIKTLRAGEGFLSQSSKWIHFGLGSSEGIDRVDVRWPGTREVESFTGLASDGRYRLVQGSGKAVAVSPRSPEPELASSEAEAPPTTDRSRTLLAQRRPLAPPVYRDFQGADRTLDRVATSAILINLWASWCQPCLIELKELAQHRQPLEKSGIAVLALCTDTLGPGGTSDLTSALEYLQRAGLPFETGVASESFVRELSSLHNQVFYRQRPLPLPTSFLVDRTGHVAAIYKGPVSPAQLLQDVTLLDAGREGLEFAALPFAGSRAISTDDSNPIELARAYHDGGYLDDARAEVNRFLDVLASIEDMDSLADAMRRTLQPGVTMELGVARAGGASVGPMDGSANLPRHDSRLGANDGAAAEIARARPQLERALRARRLGAEIQAYQMLAKIEHDRQDYDQEIAALRRLVELSPRSVTARTNLATSLWEGGRGDSADPLFGDAQRLASDDPQKLDILGLARMRLGQFDLAVDHFRQALRRAPDTVNIRLNLAMALHLRGQAADAISEYQRILGNAPQSREAMNNLAWLYATHPQPDLRSAADAIKLSRRLCQSTRYEVPAYLDTLAASLAEAGQFTEAASVTARAIPLARGRGEHALAKKLQGRLANYRAGQPVREGQSTEE